MQRTLRRRGQFEIKGPNRVWSIDGHDKLSPFGFQIYAAIDAYSRRILWCYVGHSNRTAVSVNKQFLTTVRQLNIFPKLIRSDMGGETILLCNSQLLLRRTQKPDLPFHKAYSYGTSTRNQRIESWWNLLANAQTDTWRSIFGSLREQGLFTGGYIDEACLQYIYMPMVREHIYTFVEHHNRHRIRYQRNRSHYLPTGRPNFLYQYPRPGVRNYGTIPVPNVLDALDMEMNQYILDEYLPTTTLALFEHILQQANLPTTYTFGEDHINGYVVLRTNIHEMVDSNGLHLEVLERPLGVENWLERNGSLQEIEHEQAIQQDQRLEMLVEETDNEGEDSFHEEQYDGKEDFEDQEFNSDIEEYDDILDDGIILDID